MQHCKFYFRHLDPSQSLQEYTEGQIEGIRRFLLSESRWQVEFSRKKHTACTIIKVSHPWGFFQAEGLSSDFYSSVDIACEKIIQQIKKKKAQLQYHKKPHKSKEAKLYYMTPDFEYHPQREVQKKSA